ncbi:MAG TPA: MmcQ/YjbR family DNA-binding protein [Mycobacteriales bacterium]|nr:MmcQ/YjbR family DNA-binding protein [Mycobacteriales bacterium]
MVEDPLERLRGLCLALPETTERFWCAAPPGVREELVATGPERYFRPPYGGQRGWLGVYLDVLADWDEIAEIVTDAYRTIAPKRLLAELDQP